MRRTRPRLLALGLALATGLAVRASAGAAADPKAGIALKDLYFGEALYHAYQGQFFDAIQRLDTEVGQYRGLDEPSRDTLHYHIRDAEFSVGDFELDYRMHHKAGRAIKAVLEGAVDDAVRNEAAFRLARIHFQKDQIEEAQQALARIQGPVPEGIRDDLALLRANVDMATGRADDAVKVLRQAHPAEPLAGFTAYNLGIALFQDGRTPDAIEQLDRAGVLAARDDAGQAIRDKANLVAGTMLFEAGRFDRAKQALDRVRLDGPFSNQALLRAGWAEATAGQFDRALVPWSLLVDRDPTDPAVQEALLAVPHAYSSLKLHGRAAVLYARAIESLDGQLGKVDASIASIREGRFLKALVREESRQDETWVIRLRSLPGAPETFYLTELMASHDFQTALHNYLDLEDLQARLDSWGAGLDAFADLIRLRAGNYDPLLPEVDTRFRELDSRMRLRLEQRRHLGERLEMLLTAPKPELLATADERIALETLAEIDKRIKATKGPQAGGLRERAARLRGLISWRLVTEYDHRLTEAYAHLKELNKDVDALNARYESFVRARQAATHSYAGYDAKIQDLRLRVGAAREHVASLMTQQGRLIESVAMDQLQARREHMVDQQAQARFAVADSYDRAARAQSGQQDSGEEKH
jgi:tetratricopeptide (TPR) repeat protein